MKIKKYDLMLYSYFDIEMYCVVIDVVPDKHKHGRCILQVISGRAGDIFQCEFTPSLDSLISSYDVEISLGAREC